MGRNERTGSLIGRAALFGAVAGLRSTTPLALLALRWGNAPRRAGWRDWPVLRNRWGRAALVAAAGGEIFIGDKHPESPSRLQPGPLGGRITFGALAGFALASGGSRRQLWLGGTAGALGGLAGSYGGYHARRSLVAQTGLPDPVVALGEDALAVGLGLAAIRAEA